VRIDHISELLSGKRDKDFASGFSETKPVKKAQKLGAGQHVKKPYTLAKLGIAINNELGK